MRAYIYHGEKCTYLTLYLCKGVSRCILISKATQNHDETLTL